MIQNEDTEHGSVTKRHNKDGEILYVNIEYLNYSNFFLSWPADARMEDRNIFVVIME